MSDPGEMSVDSVETLHKGQEDGVPQHAAKEISKDEENLATKR